MKTFLANLILISALLFQNESINLFIQIILWVLYSILFIAFSVGREFIHEQWKKENQKIVKDYFSVFMSIVFIGVFLYLDYVFLAVMQFFVTLLLQNAKSTYIEKQAKLKKDYPNIGELL